MDTQRRSSTNQITRESSNTTISANPSSIRESTNPTKTLMQTIGFISMPFILKHVY